MKTLYIIRGLPGSGKSTLANQLTPFVCEADQYFMVNEEYQFNPEHLSLAHAFCESRCVGYMEEEVPIIAIANTFTRHWEFAKYIVFALDYGYRIVEITLTGDIYGNLHGVPLETIEAMKARWEV